MSNYIQARQYASVRDNLDAYRAIRQRFYAQPPKPSPILPPPEVIPTPPVDPPKRRQPIGRADLPPRLTPLYDIIWATSDSFGIKPTELLGDSRRMCFVWPRSAAIAIARHLTKRSLNELGRKFKRDHSSILLAIRRMEPIMAVVVPTMPPDATVEQWATAVHQEMKVQGHGVD